MPELAWQPCEHWWALVLFSVLAPRSIPPPPEVTTVESTRGTDPNYPLTWYELEFRKAVAYLKSVVTEQQRPNVGLAERTEGERALYLLKCKELEMPWVLVNELAEPALHCWELRKMGYPKLFSMLRYEEQGIPPTLVRSHTTTDECVAAEGRQVDWRQLPSKLWQNWWQFNTPVENTASVPSPTEQPPLMAISRNLSWLLPEGSPPPSRSV